MPKVKIISCSNQFSWYKDIAKIKDDDKENVHKKIFDVTEHYDGYYKTTSDVAGPDVKGFIDVDDVIVI